MSLTKKLFRKCIQLLGSDIYSIITMALRFLWQTTKNHYIPMANRKQVLLPSTDWHNIQYYIEGE